MHKRPLFYAFPCRQEIGLLCSFSKFLLRAPHQYTSMHGFYQYSTQLAKTSYYTIVCTNNGYKYLHFIITRKHYIQKQVLHYFLFSCIHTLCMQLTYSLYSKLYVLLAFLIKKKLRRRTIWKEVCTLQTCRCVSVSFERDSSNGTSLYPAWQ